MKHICDVNGVLLEVVYFGQPPVEIQSVHVLDVSYRPTGPDLTFLLHDALLMTELEGEAEHFLSRLVGDLPCAIC